MQPLPSFPLPTSSYPSSAPVSPRGEETEMFRERNSDDKPKSYWENSFFIKALSLIPIIGIIPSLAAERSLAAKFKKNTSPLEAKKILQIEVSHKTITVARDLFTLAGIVALLALSVWTILNVASFFVLAAGAATIVYGVHTQLSHIGAIHDKNQAIKGLGRFA